tara:strand:- start:2874 stop:3185 length:312 start_codon:yes stop_codon:yes gene_type:complete
MALNKRSIEEKVGEWVVLISNDEVNTRELDSISVSCPTQIRQYSDTGKFVLTRRLTKSDVSDDNFCQYLISIWDTEERLQRFISYSQIISSGLFHDNQTFSIK